MYKLFWAKGTASFGAQAVLEEGGLEYELIRVDITSGEHIRPEYLAINPLGKVPALILPDGQHMYEVAAIMLYLAEHHKMDKLAPGFDDPLRGLFYRSLFHLTNTVQTNYKRFYYPERFSTDPADAPRIKAKAVEDLIADWRPVDDHLAQGGPYHLGQQFSLVDIYLVMLATWFRPMDELLQTFPAVRRCYELVAQRAAIAKCLQQQPDLSLGKI